MFSKNIKDEVVQHHVTVTPHSPVSFNITVEEVDEDHLDDKGQPARPADLEEQTHFDEMMYEYAMPGFRNTTGEVFDALCSLADL